MSCDCLKELIKVAAAPFMPLQRPLLGCIAATPNAG